MNVKVAAAGGFVMGLVAGGFLGARLMEKRLVSEFEERLDTELNLVRRMHKPDHNSPEEMVEDLYGKEAAAAIMEYNAEPREPVSYDKIRVSTVKVEKEAEAEVISRRVFEPPHDRGPIYVISRDEFTENDPGHEQDTLTYYAKDGVVTDTREDRIEDYANVIGTDFVNHFGTEGDDENVVLVRNEILLQDFEILRSFGSYTEEVLQEEYQAPPERPSQRIKNGG
jgi:hypothetical protein